MEKGWDKIGWGMAGWDGMGWEGNYQRRWDDQNKKIVDNGWDEEDDGDEMTEKTKPDQDAGKKDFTSI